MKKILTLFITISLLFTQQLSARPVKNGKVNSDVPKAEQVKDYFTQNNVIIDSCSNLDLYNSVYKWIGTHYKYHSKKGDGGIDCSGFTKIIYKEVYDKNLTGGSHELFPQTHPVIKADLQEGDMVFFKINRGRISHVGVYLGNNKFAHAAVIGGVRIDDLDEPYYKKYFYKGGRL